MPRWVHVTFLLISICSSIQNIVKHAVIMNLIGVSVSIMILRVSGFVYVPCDGPASLPACVVAWFPVLPPNQKKSD